MLPSASHHLSLRAVTGLVQDPQEPQSSPQPRHSPAPMVRRRARLRETASLPSCANCHQTFNSHTQPRNSAGKAVPLRAGAGNGHGGCGTEAQQARCGERQAEIRQGCRAARCAPAVGSCSLPGQQWGALGPSRCFAGRARLRWCSRTLCPSGTPRSTGAGRRGD